MNDEVRCFLAEREIYEIRFVDIRGYIPAGFEHYQSAVFFFMPLSQKFILDVYEDKAEGEEYLEKEAWIEDTADTLAEFLCQSGWKAYAQSEKNNIASGFTEKGYVSPEIMTGLSPIPQKTLGRISGAGFIGKNNLLVTKEYGCGITMSSVLTNAPLKTGDFTRKESGCGTCEMCKIVCPSGALSGETWNREKGREHLLDIGKCTCPLKCMVHCPFTLKYANK